MKKIFVILATRNESDIIESFCRYNLTFCDGMIIYERKSSDNTNEIIRKLIAEGFPIYLYDDPDIVLEPFAEGNVTTSMAYRAINEYGADLVVPLDTDEFLYHTDGINPRETLEALREDVEYQTLWRTYVYEKEPDIELGFMPNNFTQYRNLRFEQYKGNRKVMASRHLLLDKKATFVTGAHFLAYPKKYHNSIKIEIIENLFFSHFPVRSIDQITKKVILNWIYKWITSNRISREYLDSYQMGKLYNHLRNHGEFTTADMINHSIEYAVVVSKENNLSVNDLKKIENDLGSKLTIIDPMKVSFCSDKLKLRYTSYNEDNKLFLRATLTEIDRAVTFLSTESDEKSKIIEKIKAERDRLVIERDGLIGERDRLVAVRDGLLNSRSWRITKPLRNFAAFVRRHKILLLFVKGLLFIKRKGIKATIRKIINYRQEQTRKKLSKFITLSKAERLSQENTVFPKKIKISIITPLYNTPEKFLKEMIQSVKAQTYSNWELCLADGSNDEYRNISRICNAFAEKDKRIKYKKLHNNFGISGNSNIAIEMSTGEYIGLLDHDDMLHPSALFEVMKAICNEDADFIYTDEATLDNDNHKITLKHYKSDYAIDTLRSYNYIVHFSVFSRKLMDQAGTFRSEFDGSQDYDLILRYTDIASKIYHIPKLLYFWRRHENSVALDVGNKFYAITAAKKAIKEHLIRHDISARVESTKVHPSLYKIIYDLTDHPLVSIIIPNKDHVSLLQTCLSSIKEKTTYSNYEIIIVENNSVEDTTFAYYEELKKQTNIRIVYWEEKGFNYGKINNYGVQYAHGQYLIFLNNDVEIITPDWIEEMLMFSQRGDVGAMGIKLYYPDNTIQHAGIMLGIGEIAGYIYYGEYRDTIGYMGKLQVAQNISAVTTACMMIKKLIFEEVDHFSSEFNTSLNDVDLCLKIRRAGYLIVWTPFVEAYHHKPKTYEYNNSEVQGILDREITLFKTKWVKELTLGDQYYNFNFLYEKPEYCKKNIIEDNSLLESDKKCKDNDKSIIFVSHDAVRQGAQLLALNIIRQLKETFNYDVYLILKSSGNLLNEFKIVSKEVVCLDTLSNKDLEDWIKSINVKKAICNTVVTGDILHLLTICGVECISLIHEMENMIRRLSCEKIFITIINDAVKIIFPSDFLRKSNERIAYIPEEKIICCPQGMFSYNPHLAEYNTVRLFIRKKHDIPEDSKVVLGIGNGEYRKGFDLFVRCMLEVCKDSKNTYFIWLGNIEKKLLSEANKILKTSNLKNKFITNGWENNHTQYYVAADVFLLPSREDPFPSVVLEAMYAYLPVIAFENGGGYVDIVNEETGGLVPMGNIEAMAEKTLELLKNNDLRNKIGKYSHELVEKQYNFLKYVYYLLEISGFEYKKVSVIIPNYNYERYLVKRIESILSQTYPVFEIIILDDCSNDNSIQIIEEYVKKFPLRIKLIKNENNSGNVFKQWSKGISRVKGDYVWIAEADDLSDKTFLERIISGMSVDKNIVMGYSQSKTIDESGNIISDTCLDWNNEAWNDNIDIWRSDYVIDGKDEIEKRLSVKNTIFNVSAVVFKNDGLLEISKNIEDYRLAGDWRFYVDVLKFGGKILFLSDSLNFYRRHTNSVTKMLDVQMHYNEVCKMQEYVYSLTNNTEYFDKAKEYREVLKEALDIK
jgi:glycosyltransferase involved in cell wall biosynthesis